MELKRRIALAAALLGVGLGAGHIVQNRAAKPQQTAEVSTATPTKITSLAADAQTATPKVAEAKLMPSLPAAAVVVAPEKVAPTVPLVVEPVQQAKPAAPLTPIAPATPTVVAGEDCPVQLDLAVKAGAMLEVTMITPCRMGERIVLKHGGFAITEKTSSTGFLFLTLPAMEQQATLQVLFGDGVKAEAKIAVPEMANIRRFAVQWSADDAFQLHAFADGADYGTPGHISAANPGKVLPGVPVSGGYLSLIGREQVDLPMLAEVYTYPAAVDAKVEMVVEAAVTPKTCGRELLGETLTSFGGEVIVTDLTVAMPDCEAAGDILVLKNLVPDMKIAAK
ncbi:MAG: hypothetical protein WCC57_08420 [Paracoccaceae bacterium]